jgi:hypothetical protein
LNLKKNEKSKPITSIKTTAELIKMLEAQLLSLPYEYSVLTNEIEVIPKRIFYQWALANESYLEGFINANNVPNSTYSNDDFV